MGIRHIHTNIHIHIIEAGRVCGEKGGEDLAYLLSPKQNLIRVASRATDNPNWR